VKIFIVCSKSFYEKVSPIKDKLESQGYDIDLPLSFDNPKAELEVKQAGSIQHAAWKANKLREQIEKVKACDAVLVLNFEKNGVSNYIGGATFLEVFKAWELDKKIYFYNPLPEGILRDELIGMNPTILNGNVDLINQEVKQ
jgi:hypothetical protein